jgi:hypothetical protein
MAAWYESIRWREGLITAALFLLIVIYKWHPVIYVAAGAVVGILFGSLV